MLFAVGLSGCDVVEKLFYGFLALIALGVSALFLLIGVVGLLASLIKPPSKSRMSVGFLLALPTILWMLVLESVTRRHGVSNVLYASLWMPVPNLIWPIIALGRSLDWETGQERTRRGLYAGLGWAVLVLTGMAALTWWVTVTPPLPAPSIAGPAGPAPLPGADSAAGGSSTASESETPVALSEMVQDMGGAATTADGRLYVWPNAGDTVLVGRGYHGLAGNDVVTCAIDPDGGVECFRFEEGRLTREKLDVVKPAKKIAISRSLLCVLSQDSTVTCHELSHEEGSKLGPAVRLVGLSRTVDIAVTTTMGVAVDASGAAFEFSPSERPRVVTRGVVAVSLKEANSCYVMTTGRVGCGSFGASNVPLKNVTQAVEIAAGTFQSCARTKDGAVFCAETPEFGAQQQITLPGPAEALASIGSDICAHIRGTFHCWARPSSPTSRRQIPRLP